MLKTKYKKALTNIGVYLRWFTIRSSMKSSYRGVGLYRVDHESIFKRWYWLKFTEWLLAQFLISRPNLCLEDEYEYIEIGEHMCLRWKSSIGDPKDNSRNL